MKNGKYRRTNYLLALNASAIALLAVGTAVAQGVPADQVEEVVVTARRVQESMQSVPVAVTALSGTALEARSVVGLRDLSQTVPSLSFEGAARSSGGGANASVFLRGVGQDDFLITYDPGVGIYIDGIYLGRSVGAVLDLQDLERVEVLRGPQGTLFGRNTIGGAIQLVSRTPGRRPEAKLTAGVRSDGGVEGSLMLNAPLGEWMAVRASGQWRKQDGFARNSVTGGELGDVNRRMGRVQLRIEPPSGGFSVDLAADASAFRENGVQTSLLLYQPVDPNTGRATLAATYNGLVGLGNGTDISQADVSADPDSSNLNKDGVNDTDASGVSAIAAWQLSPAITLKSLTAWRWLEADFSGDLDGTDAALVDTFYRTRQRQFSQELQVSGNLWDDRLTFVGGAYYFRERAREAGNLNLIDGIFGLIESLPGPAIPLVNGISCATSPQLCAGGPNNPNNAFYDLNFLLGARTHVESYAAFGEANFEILPDVRLTVGARYTRDDKSLDYSARRIGGSGPVYGGAAGEVFAIPPSRLKDDYSAFTPKLGLDWRLSPEAMIYVSAAKGFKSGGFNGRASSAADFGAFAPEKIWSYEAGLKSDLFGRRLRVNVAAFYSDYKDIQLTVTRQAPNGTTISPVENAGAAEIYGIEAETVWRVTDAFTLSGSGALLHAEYTAVGNAAGIAVGNRLPKTSRVQLSGSAEYEHPLTGDFELRLRTDASYRSKQYNEATNFEPLAQPGYAVVNARAAIGREDGAFEIAAWVKNLFDERYLMNGFRSGVGTQVGFFARGREVGLTATARF